MGYFRECQLCGATLDPGEKCECQEESRVLEEKWSSMTVCNMNNGQIVIDTKALQVS